ncbi:MAG TPA: hypothetical protein PLL77_07955 [Pyrinomonadaceae bacterium]|nr:hypothetical protein [Pyrinomonadaceae bacterium]
MKRFIFSILCVSVFFIGVGSLVERTGAKFKSDEKALALIAKARQAIGGDAAVSSVQSMVIVGKTTRQMKINGVAQPQEGETEIAVQFPDKMSRTMKMGHGDPNGDAVKIFDKQVDVVVVGGDKDNMKVIVNGEGHGEGTGANISKKIVVKKDDGTVLELTGADADKWIAEHPGVPGEKHVIIKKGDGDVQEFKTSTSDKVIVRDGNGGNATFTTKDGKTFDMKLDDHSFMRTAGSHGDPARHNDLLRLTLSLLLTAPQGMDVEYTYGGSGDVDGRSCNIVLASFGGQSYKLYLDGTSNLPVMMSYTGMRMPQMFTVKLDPANGGGDAVKDKMVFTHKVDGPDAKSAELQVRFSDYRSTGGVQLPYKWTQTAGGEVDETFDVTSYEINPANIADRFKGQKVMVRMKKPEDK